MERTAVFVSPVSVWCVVFVCCVWVRVCVCVCVFVCVRVFAALVFAARAPMMNYPLGYRVLMFSNESHLRYITILLLEAFMRWCECEHLHILQSNICNYRYQYLSSVRTLT